MSTVVESIERADGDRDLPHLTEAHDKIVNLEKALISSRRIGAAIGVIMANRKVTYDQAFVLLRDASQATHRKLRELADDVLLAGILEHPVGIADGAPSASPDGSGGDTGDGPR